jgi:hypothetical protein
VPNPPIVTPAARELAALLLAAARKLLAAGRPAADAPAAGFSESKTPENPRPAPGPRA